MICVQLINGIPRVYMLEGFIATTLTMIQYLKKNFYSYDFNNDTLFKKNFYSYDLNNDTLFKKNFRPKNDSVVI